MSSFRILFEKRPSPYAGDRQSDTTEAAGHTRSHGNNLGVGLSLSFKNANFKFCQEFLFHISYRPRASRFFETSMNTGMKYFQSIWQIFKIALGTNVKFLPLKHIRAFRRLQVYPLIDTRSRVSLDNRSRVSTSQSRVSDTSHVQRHA